MIASIFCKPDLTRTHGISPCWPRRLPRSCRKRRPASIGLPARRARRNCSRLIQHRSWLWWRGRGGSVHEEGTRHSSRPGAAGKADRRRPRVTTETAAGDHRESATGRLRRLGRGRVNVGSGQFSGSGAGLFHDFPCPISSYRRLLGDYGRPRNRRR